MLAWHFKKDTRLTSDEVVVCYDAFLGAISLLVCSHYIGCPGPKQVVAQKHSNRPDTNSANLPALDRLHLPITFGDLANDLVCNIPSLGPSTIFGRTEDFE